MTGSAIGETLPAQRAVGVDVVSARHQPADCRRGYLCNTAKFSNPAQCLRVVRRKLRGMTSAPFSSRPEIYNRHIKLHSVGSTFQRAQDAMERLTCLQNLVARLQTGPPRPADGLAG